MSCSIAKVPQNKRRVTEIIKEINQEIPDNFEDVAWIRSSGICNKFLSIQL